MPLALNMLISYDCLYLGARFNSHMRHRQLQRGMPPAVRTCSVAAHASLNGGGVDAAMRGECRLQCKGEGVSTLL